MAENPRLPEYWAPTESLSRPSATSINRTQGFNDSGENRQTTLTITGLNKRIPVVYGEARVPGYHLVAPRIHNSELLMAVAWSWGECEGVQTMYINGEAVPAGVTLTHYTGTSGQGIDPTLDAAIPGFGDTFAGVAYTVISIPTGTVSGFPNTAQIEAVFRGRLLFDPRDSTTSYSANPGLAIADFVQSTDYGPGLTISGVADVADRCDEVVGGVEVRAQIGISLRDGQRLDAWLDVLSAYAECLWSYDGDGVLIVPDAPSGFARDSEAGYWDADGVWQTAAIDEPRWDHDPITGERLGLLVEGQSTNLLTRSSEFDHSDWSKSANISVTSSSTENPFADVTPYQLECATDGDTKIIQGVSSGTVFSVYAKSGTANWLLIFPIGTSPSAGVWFDLSSGEIGSEQTTGVGSIEPIGNGWYRCTTTWFGFSDDVPTSVNIEVAEANGASVANAGDTLYVAAAQLEQNHKATSYIATTDTTVTRAADEDDGRLAAIFWDDVVEGSFQFQGQSLDSAPTVVTINYRPSTGTAEQWRDEPYEVRLPEVDSGEAPEIRSDVSMPGIERQGEAQRKATTRLRRLQFPAKYAWQMHDSGVKFKRGDIVQLPPQRGLEGWMVRILSVEMIRTTGIYQITAEHYDPSIYPEDFTPTGETTVPVGGILPYSGSTAPSGWAFWGDANGRYIVAQGDSSAHGDTGGDNTVSVTGTTDIRGSHTGGSSFYYYDNSTTFGSVNTPNQFLTDGAHSHPFSGSSELEPIYRRLRFIEKTGSPGQIPKDAGVFSSGELIASALSAVTAHVGRVVKAGSSKANGGQSYSRTIPVSLESRGSHDHRGDLVREHSSETQFSSIEIFSPQIAGSHNHAGTDIPVSFNVRRKRLAHYVATATTDIIPGCIIGLKPGETIPSGWHLCDGNNGTVDLRDYFIEISSPNDAGGTVGSNSGATWSGFTDSDGAHNHKGGSLGSTNLEVQSVFHDDTVNNHTHEMTGSDPNWMPEYYVVRFIEYTGVA